MTIIELPGEGVDAIPSDGGLVGLRSITEGDAAGIRALHARASDRSSYLRFFSSNRATANSYVGTLTGPNGYHHHGLAALTNGEVVGVASFERLNERAAEIALLVGDSCHHQGIGTLLLERLVAVARQAGVQKFVAEVRSENALMTEALRHLGYPMHTDTDHGIAETVFDISSSRAVGLAHEGHERSADVASLTAALSPRSIAVVVGPGHPSPIEQLLLDNLTGAGFTGEVHTVGPDRGPSARVPSVSALTRLPAPPDMAIIIGAEKDAVAEIDRCGRAGVKAVVLAHHVKHPGVGSGDEPQGRRELAAARRYGMRLLGPGCAGVVNTNPDVRLNATLVTAPMRAGGLGLLAQSGELGLAVMLAAASRGLGVSQFVSMGDRLDVNEDDLMLRWAADPDTTVIALMLDDLVDAARFAVTVRDVADHTPILAYVPPDRFGRARDVPGRAGPGAVRAVLRSCGVRVMSTTVELIDTAQTLARRPPA